MLSLPVINDNRQTPEPAYSQLIFGDLGKSGGRDRFRTCDPLIKSQLLYQLSYAPTFLAGRWCRPEAMAAYNHG
jgi:hypothetical protein